MVPEKYAWIVDDLPVFVSDIDTGDLYPARISGEPYHDKAGWVVEAHMGGQFQKDYGYSLESDIDCGDISARNPETNPDDGPVLKPEASSIDGLFPPTWR